MAIGVQSFPELYTTLMGWHLYDQLWSVLSKTGLAFLPFIGILLKNIGQPYTSQETKDASSTSLRRMEVDLFVMLALIFFGASPVMGLNPSLVSFTPVCQPNGQKDSYHPGDTGTTWDKAFTIPSSDAKVPLWWYAVMSISEGFASSANTMVACVPNLRKMVTEVNTAQITNPALKQEVQQFELNCYIPARTQYLEDTHADSQNINQINTARKTYGSDDTEWLGSHGFQNTYYQNLHAQQPVQGFPYNPSDDINSDTNKGNPPAYGTPTCSQWWNDPQNGLKSRVYKALPKDFGDEFQSFFEKDNKGILKDNVIKRIVSNVGGVYQNNTDPLHDNGTSRRLTEAGTELSQITAYPKIYAAIQSAPIIQALLLLMVYTFLPFALVFTGYKPASFISGGIIVFSIIFWSFIWHLVTYVDTTLMNALYTNSWFSQHTPTATLVDMITLGMIVIAPLFWFSFMGGMGVAIGAVVGKAFSSMNSVGEQAASEGGNAAETVAMMAVKGPAGNYHGLMQGKKK